MNKKERLFQDFKAQYDGETVDREALIAFAENHPDYTKGTAIGLFGMMPKAGRGLRAMEMVGSVEPSNVVPMEPVQKPADQKPEAEAKPRVRSTIASEVYVPSRDPNFVRWGHFNDIKKIIQSGMFYPVMVTGMSGNGKTMMVEQACAEAKREYVRVQITPETDEDDLIGGFRLVAGETVFEKGPVIKAMEHGAILLVDEIDRGSNKLMTLQGVLEGKPVLIKKTGEVILPAPGFNIFGTANTKGQGDETGRFIAANILDDAFLERFTITFEQPYPTDKTEYKIVYNHLAHYGVDSDEASSFANLLVTWGQAIRKTYQEGGIDDLVATRRLCHIAQTHAIFNDRKKSVSLCVNRFEDDTKAAMIDLYDKIDASNDPMNATTEPGKFDFETDETPF